MNKKDELIQLGVVTAPHGIRGEAQLSLFNPDYEDSILDKGMKVWVYPASLKSSLPPQGEEWVIKNLRFGNKVICEFEGIKDRTHLETFLPFNLYLDRASFPEPEEDEFYLVDLMDCEVVDEKGEKLGTIEAFSDNGVQFLLDVRLLNGELLTLPYIKNFFPVVDFSQKKLTMILPEYTQ